MKQYTVFVCDICGFESKDQEVMLHHEADHYDLTIAEYDGYKHMIGFAKFCLTYALNEDVPVDRRQRYKETYKNIVTNIKKFEQTHTKLTPTEWKEI